MSFTSYGVWKTPMRDGDGNGYEATVMFSFYDSWEDRTYVLYTDGTVEGDSPSLRLLVAELVLGGQSPDGSVACEFRPVGEDMAHLVRGMFRNGPHPGLDRTPMQENPGAGRPSLLVDPRTA